MADFQSCFSSPPQKKCKNFFFLMEYWVWSFVLDNKFYSYCGVMCCALFLTQSWLLRNMLNIQLRDFCCITDWFVMMLILIIIHNFTQEHIEPTLISQTRTLTVWLLKRPLNTIVGGESTPLTYCTATQINHLFILYYNIVPVLNVNFLFNWTITVYTPGVYRFFHLCIVYNSSHLNIYC